MERKAHATRTDIDYRAYGREDGQCIYSESRHTEESRRQRVLKAAKELRGHAANSVKYLDGLEVGAKQAGASDMTARRLRYEVAAIIDAYIITVELDSSRRPTGNSWQQLFATRRLDFHDLEAEQTWQGLVNTARQMRIAGNKNKRRAERRPSQSGRGNHGPRKFEDRKFEQLRVQLLDRTAHTQVLDLLDTAIIAVATVYTRVAPDEVRTLRAALQRICDKVNEGKSLSSGVPSARQSLQGLV